MVTNPNYKPGVGRLVTDRYDFQQHIDGGAFYHKASSVKLDTPLTINLNLTSDVQAALQALKIQVDSVATPADASAISKGLIQLAGDIGGTATSVKVTGLRGTPVANLSPTNGQVLKFNSGTGNWEPSSNSVFVTGGDVGGVSGALVVNGIKTIPLDGGSVLNGTGMVYNSSLNIWQFKPMINFDTGASNFLNSTLSFTAGGISMNGTSTIALAGSGTFLTVGSGSISNFNTGSRLNFDENARLDMTLGATSEIFVTDGFITVGGLATGAIVLNRTSSIIADSTITPGPNNEGSIVLKDDSDWLSFGPGGRTVTRTLILHSSGGTFAVGAGGTLTNELAPDGPSDTIALEIGSEFYGARLKTIILSTRSYNPTNAAVPASPGTVALYQQTIFPYGSGITIIGSGAVFTYSALTNYSDLVTIDLTAANHIISENKAYYLVINSPTGANSDQHDRGIFRAKIVVDQIYNQKI